MRLKIGITERGDAGLDFSWIDKLNSVNGAILISKRIASEKFQDLLLKYKDKLILHSTITFLGNTNLEPNVPIPEDSIKGLERIVKLGFDPNKIVFRLDPILNIKQINKFSKIIPKLLELNITRIRFSFMDFYKHVKQRFIKNNIEIPKLDFGGFHMHEITRNIILTFLSDLAIKYKINLESCGENINTEKYPLITIRGCISDKDLDLLNINYDKDNLQIFAPRQNCHCLNIKHELLNNRSRCQHNCLYCFWKD